MRLDASSAFFASMILSTKAKITRGSTSGMREMTNTNTYGSVISTSKLASNNNLNLISISNRNANAKLSPINIISPNPINIISPIRILKSEWGPKEVLFWHWTRSCGGLRTRRRRWGASNIRGQCPGDTMQLNHRLAFGSTRHPRRLP